MVYVSIGLLLVGAVTALNLVLILAVIRRLRRHEEERKRLFDPETVESGPPTGEPLPAFTAVATDGTRVASDALLGREAALTFLSTDCSICVSAAADLPEFARLAGLDATQMVVVIAGEEKKAREIAAPLDGVAMVVLEEAAGPLSTQYAIMGTPTTVLVDPDGKVTYARAGTNPVLDRTPA
ncbi:TlpA family protein disulfide reductase [Streptomyces albipurpureus]|uniref:TlpA family protein disulfide reductase n=1 Tax=Streptomyces albipurpureus TaxID=2897419 RepID=A0ABT0UL22_9ACTN|nr:TlpA disulfide reductase family protein [Streptomyces sp. CWNU-1]MCM2388315.1 TlpA family protein disulfide reductase [Streptomyces sp. CWNU-1]